MATKTINVSSFITEIQDDNKALHTDVESVWAAVNDINNDIEEIKVKIDKLLEDVAKLKG